jgi:O-methyltransferase
MGVVNYTDLYSSELVDHSKDMFMSSWQDVKIQTLLTPGRLWHLWVLSRATMHLEGDMAECGTYMGGSARLISKATNYVKSLDVFDTFEGMPEQYVLENNGCVSGDLKCDFDRVKANVSDCPNIVLHKGVVPQSLQAVEDKRFSFVYLDMDLNQPTLSALYFFWSRLVSGGVILLDDYEHIRPVTFAIEEFSNYQRRPHKTTEMQCMFYKE